MGGKSCPQCLRWKIADVKGIPVTRHAEVRLWIIFESAKKAPAKKVNRTQINADDSWDARINPLADA